MNKKYIDIQQKVINAVLEMQKGSPLKDFLTDEDIEEALSMFADVLVTLGIVGVVADEDTEEALSMFADVLVTLGIVGVEQ